MYRHFIFSVLFVLTLISYTFAAPPKNIIFFIGDGMGFEQVKAAGIYKNGTPGTLCFESFPYQAEVTTYSANSSVTDSAAAGTALATGHKVNNSVVSMAIPGDSSELQTLLEYAQNQNKSVGLVTTTYIAHATPACFAAHETSRSNYSQIINDYLTQTTPNILFGGAAYIDETDANTAGYTVVTNLAEMLSLDTNSVSYISGQFAGEIPYEYDGVGSLPTLAEMTETALDILCNDPNGFFVMVEGGKIDWAGHSNHIQRNVFETIGFANSVQKAINWASSRKDTLILVTADHETGGLLVAANNGQGQFPDVTWSTTGHTDANVPACAWGINSWLVNGFMDNTDFFDLVISDEIYEVNYVEDSDIDFKDFAHFASKWNLQNCTSPQYCDGADIDKSGSVDENDLLIFNYYWLGN